jgi:hypothetical protein
MFRSNEKIASKIIDLLADGLIDPTQWRLWIPRHIGDQPEIVKVNAKRFAEGIQEYVENNETTYVDLEKYEV